jgi:hypothetical protein
MPLIQHARDEIVEEFRRRLQVMKGPVHRGWDYTTEIQTPSTYIFEDKETVRKSEVQRQGLYEKVLPLQIEHFVKRASRKEELYPKANDILRQLVTAIELDENLRKGGPDGPGPELVVGYGMTENDIVEMSHEVVNVILVYQVSYYDTFLGFTGKCL